MIEMNQSEEDLSFGHNLPDLIDPGEYQVEVTRYDIGEFMGSRKLYMYATIVDPTHTGIELFMACNLPSKSAGIKSKFLANWIVANWGGRPLRADRLSPRIFIGAVFKSSVRTVIKNDHEEQQELSYSIIDHFIERLR